MPAGGPLSQKAKGSFLRLNKGAKALRSPQSLALRLLHKKRLKDFRLVLFSKKCPPKEPLPSVGREGGLSQEGKMLGARLSQLRACSKASDLRTLGTQNNIKVNFFRHFVPASQEWYNSIYTYNKNYPKTIPVADISLMKLFKGYFNYGIRFKFPLRVQKGGVLPPLSPQNPGSQRKAFGQIRARELTPLPMRYRLLSTKKAFLGKGDLKHTNNKVIITFYLYNANQMFISSNFNDRVKALLLPNKSLKIICFEQANPSKIILYNRMFNIYEFLASDEHYLAYYNTMGSIIKKINIVLANLNYLLAIYIYILKTKIFNDNYARPSPGGTGSHPLGTRSLVEGASKILSGKINSFFFIYNNLFKTNILKDNLKNNLFNIFFNFRLRKYRRLLLKRKFPFLITNDILKIASSPTGPALGGERDSSSASAAWLDKKGILTQGGRPLENYLRGAPFVSHLASKNLATWEESSIFNFEYYLYKMSLSYLEKVFLY